MRRRSEESRADLTGNHTVPAEATSGVSSTIHVCHTGRVQQVALEVACAIGELRALDAEYERRVAPL